MTDPDPHGPLDSDLTVNAFEMRSGWIFLRVDSVERELNQVPFVLSQALSDWLMDNPSIVVRHTLPITASGHTVGIHVWYDSSDES